jgi:hypothetical protein
MPVGWRIGRRAAHAAVALGATGVTGRLRRPDASHGLIGRRAWAEPEGRAGERGLMESSVASGMPPAVPDGHFQVGTGDQPGRLGRTDSVPVTSVCA